MLCFLQVGAAMEKKGHWAKVIGVPVAVAVVVGQSFIGYVTENGQLPPWMPEKLGGIASWLATEMSLPHWASILIVVCIGGAGALFVRLQSRIAREQQTRLVQMNKTLADMKIHNAVLETASLDLKQQIVEMAQTDKPVEPEISLIGFRMLTAIAFHTNTNASATLANVSNVLGVGKVEAHAAIDILTEHGMVVSGVTGHGAVYRFTPKGRAYYLKHKED